MTRFLRIRNSVHFRRYFDAVHPLFWPLLFWNLGRVMTWMGAGQYGEAFIEITWWGGVKLHLVGDKIEAEKQIPIAQTRPHWSDPVWSMDVPVSISDLAALETRRLQPILPRSCGGGGWPQSGQTEGALYALIPDTSLYCCFDVRFG
jgi:hypothetical protein